MSGTTLGEQSEIPLPKLDPAQEAALARRENFQINKKFKFDLDVVRKKYLKDHDKMVLVGMGKDYLIPRRKSNFDFYTKIVRLIISKQDKRATNATITFEAQKSFPDEVINKNIWSKKLSLKMKKSLSVGLIEEWEKLLVKANTLSEFKKLVISNAQLKSGNTTYKPNILISDLVMSVNGIAFPIQKNSTTKNGKKHEYAQIRVNLDLFLDALKLKKPLKKSV